MSKDERFAHYLAQRLTRFTNGFQSSDELYNELKEWEVTHNDIIEALSYSVADDLGAILVRCCGVMVNSCV